MCWSVSVPVSLPAPVAVAVAVAVAVVKIFWKRALCLKGCFGKKPYFCRALLLECLWLRSVAVPVATLFREQVLVSSALPPDLTNSPFFHTLLNNTYLLRTPY